MSNTAGELVGRTIELRRWLDGQYKGLNWDDARAVHVTNKIVMRRLYHNRDELATLLWAIMDTSDLLDRCEVHPLINRIVFHSDGDIQLRVHAVRPDATDLIPHDHKHTFSACILARGYLHVWNRRLAALSGRFDTESIAPGVVAVERPGDSYTLGNTLVHQTIMLPGTVTLFMRGPARQARWHAADDMRHIPSGYEAPSEDGVPHKGSRAMTPAELEDLLNGFAGRGIITAREEL